MASTNRTIYMILGLLAQEPQTGYSIKQIVEDTISHFWKESYGHIYPSLSRLVEAGLIERDGTDDTDGRERKLYRITPAGRFMLETWLHEPVEDSGVRNELALKIYFSRVVGRDVAARHLLEHRHRHSELLGIYTTRRQALEQRIAQGDKAAVYDVITVQAGIHISQARIAWCDEALQQLQAIKE